MRINLMLVAATVAVSSFGQGLAPRSPFLNRLSRPAMEFREFFREFKEKYPEGTNEFGRTFEQEKNFRNGRQRFLEGNPSGKNRFHRSFDEECEFEESFDLDTFLGFELGKDIGNAKTVKLAKPYRLFDLANLHTTAKGRLYKITLEKSFKDASFASLSNEIQKLVANIENTYKVPMARAVGTYYKLGSYSIGSFDQRALGAWTFPKATFEVSGNYDFETGRGSISMGVCKPKMYDADREQSKAERRAELEAKQRDVSLPDGEGAELLTSKVSNVTETSTDDHNAAREATGVEGAFVFNDKKTDVVNMLVTSNTADYPAQNTPFIRNGNTVDGSAGNEVVIPILIPNLNTVHAKNTNPWNTDITQGGIVGFNAGAMMLSYLRFSNSGLLLGVGPTPDSTAPSVRATDPKSQPQPQPTE